MSRATTAEDQPYYNAYFSAYEYPTAEDPSHDVILVGWDDTVSRFLFRDVPEGGWCVGVSEQLGRLLWK